MLGEYDFFSFNLFRETLASLLLASLAANILLADHILIDTIISTLWYPTQKGHFGWSLLILQQPHLA